MSQYANRIKRDPVVVLHQEIVEAPGGIKDAATRIGRSAGVLHNKFSEAMPHYEITVRESLALASDLESRGFIEAMCEQFDGVFVPLSVGAAGDDDVLQSYLEIIQAMGDLSREFTEARKDGIIDQPEYSAMQLRGHRTIAAILKMLNELYSQVREVPPVRPVSVKGCVA